MYISAVLFLGFGLYLSVCIWIFMIITDAFAKLSLRGFFSVRKRFAGEVDGHFIMLKEGRMPGTAEMLRLFKLLERYSYRKYFLKRFIYAVDQIRDKDLIRTYFAEAIPHLGQVFHIRRKMHYAEKSYRMMQIGEFRQDTPEINAFLTGFLDDDSFEVRTNALRALSVIGNPCYFNEGLKIACNSDKYFNPRHITDVMESFEGDHTELQQLMLAEFYNGCERYQYNVIAFLADHKAGSAMTFVLDYLMQHLKRKEIVIACMRYFLACEINTRAKEIICGLLIEDDNEILAVAVKLLPKYFRHDGCMAEMLAGNRFLKSRDWYVRRNSAASYVRMGYTKEQLLKLLPSEDLYARDALIYAMFDEGLMSFEEYENLKKGAI